MRSLVAGRVDGTLWSLRTRLPRRTPPRLPHLSATVPYEYILWCCVTSSTTISVGTTNSARGGRYRHRHVQSAGRRPRPATGAPGCGPEPGGASARVRPAPHVYILAGARPQRADAAHCVDHCPRRWPAPVGVGRAGRIGHRSQCDARVTAGWRCDTGRGGSDTHRPGVNRPTDEARRAASTLSRQSRTGWHTPRGNSPYPSRDVSGERAHAS